MDAETELQAFRARFRLRDELEESEPCPECGLIDLTCARCNASIAACVQRVTGEPEVQLELL